MSNGVVRPGFCKGYVVVEAATVLKNGKLTPGQLDVTNVVTLSQAPSPVAGQQPVALDFEYVTPNRVAYPCWSNTSPVCPP